MDEAATNLLFKCPYVRQAGCEAPVLPEGSVTLPPPLGSSLKSTKRRELPPFEPPPPAACTTSSFWEIKRTKTRPQRYGPTEVRH